MLVYHVEAFHSPISRKMKIGIQPYKVVKLNYSNMMGFLINPCS